jgi:asparagine synthase (glutamine-hydrolysing)
VVKGALPDTGLAAVFDGLGLAEDPALSAVLPPDMKQGAGKAGEAVWRRWKDTRGQAVLARQQALDYALYLPDDILVKVDRASMAHSIEVRSPFLDVRLVEWAARLPRRVLMSAREGKRPLRRLGAALLPGGVAGGGKRGFGMPVGRWFREEEGRRLVQERLLSAEAPARDLWDRAGVERVFSAHTQERGRDFGEHLWRLLMLEAWTRHYLHGDGFLRGPPPAPGAGSDTPNPSFPP